MHENHISGVEKDSPRYSVVFLTGVLVVCFVGKQKSLQYCSIDFL